MRLRETKVVSELMLVRDCVEWSLDGFWVEGGLFIIWGLGVNYGDFLGRGTCIWIMGGV